MNREIYNFQVRYRFIFLIFFFVRSSSFDGQIRITAGVVEKKLYIKYNKYTLNNIKHRMFSFCVTFPREKIMLMILL